MSTDYLAVCFTCKCRMPKAFASGSGFYGFKVWDPEGFAKWMGHGSTVGAHEGHDVRIISEHKEVPFEDELGIIPSEPPQ